MAKTKRQQRAEAVPAFPRAGSVGPEGFERAQRGLTVREYAAIAAMQGILVGGEGDVALDPEETALLAVEYADALVDKLNPEERH